MKFPANDMYPSCLMLYTRFQDTWNLHISLPHSRSLITVQYPPTELQGLVHPYLAHRNGALKPCSQILCLFLSSPDKEEHTASATTQEVSQLVFSSNSLQLQVCGLCYLYYYGPTLYQLHRFRCLRNCI